MNKGKQILETKRQTSIRSLKTRPKQIWKPKGKLSDNSLNKTKQVWKATGKIFANVGYPWRSTGKKVALGKLNCGYQWRPQGKKFCLSGELWWYRSSFDTMAEENIPAPETARDASRDEQILHCSEQLQIVRKGVEHARCVRQRRSHCKRSYHHISLTFNNTNFVREFTASANSLLSTISCSGIL
ncbi:hypothetical protein Tco_1047879 [Tanacetum coccineum]